MIRRGYSLVETLVVIGIIGTLVGLILPAISMARNAAYGARCRNNMRQIGIALTGFHDQRRCLPPGTSGPPYSYLGWGSYLLPFVDNIPLWQQTEAAFQSSASFMNDPPHVGSSTEQSIYVCPADGRTSAIVRPNKKVAFGHYLGVEGGARAQNGTMYYESKISFQKVTDGLSHTLLVGERPPGVDETGDIRLGWWYAGVGQGFGSADHYLGARQWMQWFRTPTCARGPYHFGPGRPDNPCDSFHFWSRHPSGAHFLFCDGSVHLLSYSADSVLPALASIAGREAVEIP